MELASFFSIFHILDGEFTFICSYLAAIDGIV